jgi:hypothetical protein
MFFDFTVQFDRVCLESADPVHMYDDDANTRIHGHGVSGTAQPAEIQWVLVGWDANGLPGWSIDKYGGQGTPLTIDGLPAKFQITPNGTCDAAISTLGTNSFMQEQEAVGSQGTISAVVAERVPNNYLTFNACIRGPDLPRLTQSVMASLRTTKVLSRS